MEQRTEEWFKARLGKLTASTIADATAKTKSGYGASRSTLMGDLCCQRMTGMVIDRFVNAAMQHGTDTEPVARPSYEFERGVTVVEVGFIEHPTIPNAGASPDGLVGDHGLVEIKCPANTSNHIQTLLTQEVPERYIKQMQFQLAVTGRTWCDFYSFDPRMPPELQGFVKRIERDDVMIAELEKEARLFLAELDDMVSKLRTLGKMEKAA